MQVSVITSFSNHHLGGGVRTETINHLLAFAWFDSLIRGFLYMTVETSFLVFYSRMNPIGPCEIHETTLFALSPASLF